MEDCLYRESGQTEEGLVFLKEYFEAPAELVEDLWYETQQNIEETFDRLTEQGYISKIIPSGDIIQEMPELEDLLRTFSDLNRNEVINAYFDCDNDLEKTKQTLQNSLNTSSLDSKFPPLPKPDVLIPKPPDPILESLKDKDEDQIMTLCEMFPTIRKEEIKEVFVNSCSRNFEDAMDLLFAVSEGNVYINEIITKKNNKGKSKKKNKNKSKNKNDTNILFPHLGNEFYQTSIPPPSPPPLLPASSYIQDRDFTLAEKMKLQNLCEEFPDIDSSIIIDIFLDNDMNSTITENIIKNEYLEMQYIPKPKPIKPFIPPKIEVVDVNVEGDYEDDKESIENEMSKLEERIKNRFAHAQQYYRNNKREAGNFEMERVKEDKKRFKELLLKKCEIIFDEKNKAMDKCDVHKQTQETAIKYIQDAIARCKSHGVKELKIITGVGNHSKNKKAILRPAVDNFLKKGGYKYSWGKGDVIVTL